MKNRMIGKTKDGEWTIHRTDSGYEYRDRKDRLAARVSFAMLDRESLQKVG